MIQKNQCVDQSFWLLAHLEHAVEAIVRLNVKDVKDNGYFFNCFSKCWENT